MCTSVHLYTIIICPDLHFGIHVSMSPMVIACALYNWLDIGICDMHIYIDIAKLWITYMLLLML